MLLVSQFEPTRAVGLNHVHPNLVPLLGWQYQQQPPPTIQCLVENALSRLTKLDREHLCVVGASRTDAGVHAWGQVAHFVTPFNYPCLDTIHAALNGLLPPDIRVREVAAALPEYHARFSAVSKIYHYKIYNDTIMDPLQRQLAYHCAYKLNSTVMREAAKHFLGKHDFSAFANAVRHEQRRDPIKTISRFDVVEMVGNHICLSISFFFWFNKINLYHNPGNVILDDAYGDVLITGYALLST